MVGSILLAVALVTEQPQKLLPAYDECDRQWKAAVIRLEQLRAFTKECEQAAQGDFRNQRLLSARMYEQAAARDVAHWFAGTWVTWPVVNRADRVLWYWVFIGSAPR